MRSKQGVQERRAPPSAAQQRCSQTSRHDGTRGMGGSFRGCQKGSARCCGLPWARVPAWSRSVGQQAKVLGPQAVQAYGSRGASSMQSCGRWALDDTRLAFCIASSAAGAAGPQRPSSLQEHGLAALDPAAEETSRWLRQSRVIHVGTPSASSSGRRRRMGDLGRFPCASRHGWLPRPGEFGPRPATRPRETDPNQTVLPGLPGLYTARRPLTASVIHTPSRSCRGFWALRAVLAARPAPLVSPPSLLPFRPVL